MKNLTTILILLLLTSCGVGDQYSYRLVRDLETNRIEHQQLHNSQQIGDTVRNCYNLEYKSIARCDRYVVLE